MKLQIVITKKHSKLWEWAFISATEQDYGGFCRSKRDALNDASIVAGLRWEQTTDDMQTAQLEAGFVLCCTRGLDQNNRVTWELTILDEDKGIEQFKTNVFDDEEEAKCCAPSFVHGFFVAQLKKSATRGSRKPTAKELRDVLRAVVDDYEDTGCDSCGTISAKVHARAFAIVKRFDA